MSDEYDGPSEITVCEGPPACPFEDNEAVLNQLAGCPRCRRILVWPDGSQTEYRKPVN